MSKKYDELLKEYRRLAKRADQRLVRLEKASEQKVYSKILEYGYANAKRDAVSWGANKDKPRFNIRPPKNTNQLKAKIADIKRFLSYDTSTVSGVKKVYQARANTINKDYGTNFSWDELADFFESSLWKKLDGVYYASTVFESVGVIQKNKDDILKAIEDNEDIHIKVKDAIVESAVNDIIKNQNLDIKDFFEG